VSDSFLDIAGAEKAFGATMVLGGVDLRVGAGEFVSLLGPSGCGKTTLLRIVAGLLAVDRGRVTLDGEDITAKPPHRRDVGVVFQNYALFPHLTVAENVAFGLKARRRSAAETRDAVWRFLELVHLTDFADRSVRALSGGQQQRVAVARALAVRPKLLLLDEPLAALDRKLRAGTRFELVRLQEQLGLTFVIVTHDQEEAMSMASRLAVMNAGRIVQSGTPHDLYERPATRFVADFIGIANILEVAPGRWLALRPEKIVLAASRPDTAHATNGTVIDIAYEGDRSLYRVAIENGPTMLVAVMNVARATGSPFRRGESVWLGWSDAAGQLLDE